MNDDIDRLNNGEHVVTYEMLQVQPGRKPVTGEIRFVVPLLPSPAEPLAAMVLSDPLRIIWNGNRWVKI